MAAPSGSRISKNIILLGLVSLLNDISSEIIQPILPLFIATLGGGSIAVGLIGGLSDGIPSIFKIFAGYWSDRLGKRKPLVVAGYGISAIAKIILPFSAGWQSVFVLKAAERLGKGIRSAPRDAMIAESAEKEVRGRGFGLHRAMDTSGAIVGSALAYLLWSAGLDFRTILLIAGVFSIVALAPFARVQESFKSPAAEMDLRLSDLSPDLRKFIAIASLFALGNFSYMFFILRAQEFFTGAMAVGAPLLLYILFNVIYGALAMPIGIWSDRVGRKNVLTIGYAVFAITSLGFVYVSSAAGLIVLFALYGLVFAMVDASERAFVSDLSCATVRCTSLGIYYGAVGISAIMSGLIAGGLWQGLSPGAAFLFGAFASALAALTLWRMNDIGEIL
ncbi:MAG TPA: MFS transporter [Methanotrichaceae archaeon]|nr:MFS transporter [Methanotrichaceae archaeon]